MYTIRLHNCLELNTQLNWRVCRAHSTVSFININIILYLIDCRTSLSYPFSIHISIFPMIQASFLYQDHRDASCIFNPTTTSLFPSDQCGEMFLSLVPFTFYLLPSSSPPLSLKTGGTSNCFSSSGKPKEVWEGEVWEGGG